MAVQNSLRTTESEKNNQLVTFDVNGYKVQLTPGIVRDYLVSGDKERVTMQEVVMFINLCKFGGLNPWLKEAYCIKYGNEPATMVVAKEAFLKRAEKNAAYDGFDAGIVVIDINGEIVHRPGALILTSDKIVGAYANVYRKDKSHAYYAEVSFEEYAARKKDGTLNSQWSKKPATMIRKVALVQALREAFPTDFNGMYISEEQGIDESVIDLTPIEQPAAVNPAPAAEWEHTPAPERQTAPVMDAQQALFGE